MRFAIDGGTKQKKRYSYFGGDLADLDSAISSQLLI